VGLFFTGLVTDMKKTKPPRRWFAGPLRIVAMTTLIVTAVFFAVAAICFADLAVNCCDSAYQRNAGFVLSAVHAIGMAAAIWGTLKLRARKP
jgi:hypothetical protein